MEIYIDDETKLSLDVCMSNIYFSGPGEDFHLIEIDQYRDRWEIAAFQQCLAVPTAISSSSFSV